METVAETKKEREKVSKEVKLRRKEFTRQFYRKNKFRLGVTIALYVVDAAVSASCAWLLQEVTDIATGASSTPIMYTVIFTAALVVGGLLTGIIELNAKNRFIQRGLNQYKEYAFGRIAEKNISSFADESTSRYISTLTNDVTSLETNYLNSTPVLVFNLTMFVFSIVLMFVYDWLMSVVALGASLLPMAVSIMFGGTLVGHEKRVSEHNEGFVGMIKDVLTGFSVIKSFRAEKQIKTLFVNENEKLEKSKFKLRVTKDFINTLMQIAGIIMQLGVFIFGAWLAMNGRITVGVVLAFVQLTGLAIGPIGQIPTLISNRRAAVGLIDKMADAVYEHTERGGQTVVTEIGDGIEVRDLSFAFEGTDVPVLHDLSYKFEKGKSYALVGASGSGKSTLLNLILGYFDNYSGSINIGDVDLKQIKSESLYDLVSVIQQNVFVFDSSIKNNITMFKEFDDKDIDSAIQKSGLAKLIADKGNDYGCGENGSGLSGGEKQRISIARCILKGTPVMLMDEATAALDAETAVTVTNAILDIKGLTRIIVTHRLEETILKRYDEIIVLRGGTIEEHGTFSELLEKRGFFYSLYNVAQ